ncbi:MAG: hypothetical protein KatS3mg039_0528 [Candidatus Kapaibacterium sp.]|nr:MAG: hypothetical protein KatS3mg039_0528 [Candidatus Kapabacteria bacterium]
MAHNHLRWWQRLRDRILMIAAVFGAVAGISSIPLSLDFLNPIARAIADFDITDLAQSQFRDDSDFPPDTTIVIVNIGNLDRGGIAHLLQTIVAFHPRVVGIDAFFRHDKEPLGDSVLEDALRQTPNLVLPCELLDPNDDGTFDSIATSHLRFHRLAQRAGFANVITSTERSFRTVRYFSPHEQVAAITIPSFPLAVAATFDSAQVAAFLADHDGVQEIAYLGNTDKFYVLDWSQLSADPAAAQIVHDKIVLLGYLGPQFTGTVTTLEDAFFTPLNDHYVGRSFPDMYGAVIHANIISQLLNHRSIHQVGQPIILAVAVLLCWCNIGLLSSWHRKLPLLYDGLALVMVVGQSLVVLFLTVYLYHQFTLRMPTTVLLMSVALTPTIHELYTQSLVPLLRAVVEHILGLFRRTPVAGILLILAPLQLAAQDATILNMRGTLRVIRNGAEVPASVGMVLSLSDQLQLQSGSAVTLVTSDGRSVRWTKTGTTRIHTAIAKAQRSAIAAKFAQYVFKEATSSNPDDDNYRRTMKVTGAVERAVTERRGNLDALEDVLQTTGIGLTTTAVDPSMRNLIEAAISERTIVVAFPHTTYHAGDTLQIAWFRSKAGTTYRVVFRRSDGSVAAELSASDTIAVAVRSRLGLERGIPYYWRIEERDGGEVRSQEYCVAWLRAEDEQRVLADLRQIERDMADDPALAEQLKARYLEDAGLHALAAMSYSRSAQQCNCSEYRRALVEYLRRYSYLP